MCHPIPYPTTSSSSTPSTPNPQDPLYYYPLHHTCHRRRTPLYIRFRCYIQESRLTKRRTLRGPSRRTAAEPAIDITTCRKRQRSVSGENGRRDSAVDGNGEVGDFAHGGVVVSGHENDGEQEREREREREWEYEYESRVRGEVEVRIQIREVDEDGEAQERPPEYEEEGYLYWLPGVGWREKEERRE
ncbi:hypothetical protein K402DRAFT_394315 [Aulographum hederae CBS 113979]|uniref:Uncharacterized protein n=1 Tax=Aulographum hederae CBS 113979 TaxID=1176131 RepID=A0A6G1GYP7_9PEZI|nr:hypothetical protein K402DRAFT_394315 [Aulographum hederae CBS 113979]